MSAEYIENLTLFEKDFYVHMLKEMLKKEMEEVKRGQ